MNFDLLSQYPLIITCIIETILFSYVVIKLKKKWKRNEIIFGLALSFILSGLINLWVIHEYEGTQLPNFLFFMLLPFTVNISLLIIIFRQKYRKHKVQKRLIVCASLLVSVALTFLIVNNYFSFYPTVYSLFGVYQGSGNLTSQEVVLKFNPNSLPQQTSIEAGLDSLNNSNLNGKVYSLNIPGKVSKFQARPAWIYVPYIATHESAVKLPVLVLLAGVPGYPDNWVGSGAATYLDEFANSHKGITPIVFMVDDTGTVSNDTECVNSPRGNVETYLTVDVPNYIKSHFNVSDNPSNWGIGGLSMGGMCSIMLTLRHPNVYRTFLDLGGEIGPTDGSGQTTIDTLFGGSTPDYQQHLPPYLLEHNQYPDISGFFGSGKQDSIDVTGAQSELFALSKSAGINAVAETIQGQHTFDVWSQTFKDSLPWVSNQLGATQCSAACF